MRSSRVASRAASALAAVVALGTAGLAGQEPPVPLVQQTCTAEIEPAAVPVGMTGVRMMASLSEDVGPVTRVEGPEGSGIAMSSPEDVPRTAMVAPGSEVPLIQPGAGENTWAFWLNTVDASPGDHTLRIIADGGVCEGRLAVTPGT